MRPGVYARLPQQTDALRQSTCGPPFTGTWVVRISALMTNDDNHHSHDDRSRLARLIREGRAIPYLVDNPDREHPRVRWCIYGVPETNQLFVSATNGAFTVVRSVASPVVLPPMHDRIFGIDVDDLRVAGDLSAAIWQDHARELTAP